MNKHEVRVVRGPTLRGDVMTVVGVIPAEVLIGHHCVPRNDAHKGTGYQRNPSPPRVSKLAREIKGKSVDLPTAVLLNMRELNESDLVAKQRDNYYLQLDPQKSDNEHRMYVVDGQHRILALQKSIADGSDVGNVKIPFVCMIGATEEQEMEQFHVVNSNAKSVPTDLAFALLKKRYEHDPNFAKVLQAQGRKWEVEAQSLTERLEKSSPIWKGRIRLANMPKGETIVPAASFVRSLKAPIEHAILFRQLRNEPEKQAQILDAYWTGIKRIFHLAFEKPSEYNIQKGIGVDVLHAAFPVVLDLIRTHNMSVFKPESYVKFLEKPLTELVLMNGDGEEVQGEAVWRTGRKGAAGGYSSAAGKRQLAEILQARLPEPDLL